MKNWKKPLVWAIPSIIAVLVLFVVIYAQTTNLTNLDLSGTLAVTGASTLTGAVTASTAPITCGTSSIVKTMTFDLDSIGHAKNYMIFTPERAITVLRGELYIDGDTVGINTATVSLVTGAAGATSFAVACTARGNHAITTTDTNFPATECTLKTSVAAGGYNGTSCKIIYWYTDDE